MKILILSAAAFLSVTFLVNAQNDSTRYINGLPVTDDDTVEQFIENDVGVKDKIRAVSTGELPRKVLKALKKGDQYNGWEDSVIYFDENTRLFMVPVKYGEGIKIFGINEDGHPVTFDEVTRGSN
jgi:hypothetical protein